MKHANLILHCGASIHTLDDIKRMRTPEPTKTWKPIPHIDLVNEVKRVLEANKLHVVEEAHSMTHDGNRYFGLMQIRNGSENEDYSWVLGTRNTHDKMFPAGLVAGMNVGICDNLSFSGEVRLDRKHTVHIVRDLPQLIERAIGKLMDKWGLQDKRVEAYKKHEIENKDAHDLIIMAADIRAMPWRYGESVLKEWRKPEFPEFRDRTLWSLFNGFTRVLNKQGNLNELAKRTEALHGLLDSYAGLTQ